MQLASQSDSPLHSLGNEEAWVTYRGVRSGADADADAEIPVRLVVVSTKQELIFALASLQASPKTPSSTSLTQPTTVKMPENTTSAAAMVN